MLAQVPFLKVFCMEFTETCRYGSRRCASATSCDFHNVAVSAVSQGIHSDEKSARSLLALHGIIDEQYLAGVAEKVHPETELNRRAGHFKAAIHSAGIH